MKPNDLAMSLEINSSIQHGIGDSDPLVEKSLGVKPPQKSKPVSGQRDSIDNLDSSITLRTSIKMNVAASTVKEVLG